MLIMTRHTTTYDMFLFLVFLFEIASNQQDWSSG